MNNKRKRTKQGPIQDVHTGVGAKRPYPDGQDGARPGKSLKRAKQARNEATRTLKIEATITKKESTKTSQRINKPPTAPLEIFVFGDGSCGQLGLGSKTVNGESPTEAMQPRLNKVLSPKDAGIVQFACGGMHTVALTRDNKILTWGVNDLSALGHATNVEEDDDDELNPAESTPGPVDVSGLEPNMRWAQVAASDNASFALTEDGHVYGWGTFRVNEHRPTDCHRDSPLLD